MNSFNYSFGIIKSTWGIRINIDADWFLINEYKEWDNLSIVKKITDGLWYSLRNDVVIEDEVYLEKGLYLVSNAIIHKYMPDKDILIIFNKIEYNPCDYQAEGMTAAVIQWADNGMGLECVKNMDIQYSREEKKYKFSFSIKE